MRILLLAGLLASVTLGDNCLHSQDVQKKRRDAVLNDKKHFDIDSYWVYDDFEKARAEAQKTGKPLLVVFRCLP